jgi:glucose/arabinose dehydrogenase
MEVRSRISVLLALALALAAASVWAQATNDQDQPGNVHVIRPEDLPPPFESSSANNPPQLVARPAGAELHLPPNFRVDLFHDGTFGGNNSPRTMALAPNGDVFAVDAGGSAIYVLRDADGDGKAEGRFTYATQTDGLLQPFGIAFREGFLYVGNTNAVVRFPYQSGDTKVSGPAQVVVPGLPTGGHSTRNVIFSPDGQKLYVSVGSRSNVAEEPENRAAILQYNVDGTGYRRFAGGLRNPVGVAFNPVTNELWTAVNERDGLGDNLVPDYFTSVKDGGFYGWPYSYIGAHLDPRMNGKGQDLAAKAVVPDVLIQSHSAPLGAVFYTGGMFPPEYQNDAFVALHGSWNRSLRTGYKIIRVRFRDGKPVGGYEDFMTGWLLGGTNRNVWGRPVGLLVARDGALLVSDDGGHRIWRVAYSQG